MYLTINDSIIAHLQKENNELRLRLVKSEMAQSIDWGLYPSVVDIASDILYLDSNGKLCTKNLKLGDCPVAFVQAVRNNISEAIVDARNIVWLESVFKL